MNDTSRRSGAHGYICECSSLACKERLYLHPGDYEKLSKDGAVITASCAEDTERKIVRRFGHIVVVKTSWSRIGKPG